MDFYKTHIIRLSAVLFTACFAVLLGQPMQGQDLKQMGRFYTIPLTAEESIEKYAEKMKELFPERKDSIEEVEKYAHRFVPNTLEYMKNLYERESAAPKISTLEGRIFMELMVDRCYQGVLGKLGGSLFNLLGENDPAELCYQEYQKLPWLKRQGTRVASEEYVKRHIREKIAGELEKKLNELKNNKQEPWHEHFFEEDVCGYNVGFYPSGIRRDQDPTGTPGEKRYNIHIMKEADKRLASSGEWLPEQEGKPFGYHLTDHNCQHFAEKLRQEYEKIKEEIEAMETVADDYAKTRRQAALSFKLNKIDVSKCPDDFQEAFKEWRDVLIKRINGIGKGDVMSFAAGKSELRSKANTMRKTLNKYEDKFDIQFNRQIYEYIEQDVE